VKAYYFNWFSKVIPSPCCTHHSVAPITVLHPSLSCSDHCVAPITELHPSLCCTSLHCVALHYTMLHSSYYIQWSLHCTHHVALHHHYVALCSIMLHHCHAALCCTIHHHYVAPIMLHFIITTLHHSCCMMLYHSCCTFINTVMEQPYLLAMACNLAKQLATKFLTGSDTLTLLI